MEKKDGDFIVYKTFWGKKVGIINKVIGNGFYLVAGYFWHGDEYKIRWGKIIKEKDILG